MQIRIAGPFLPRSDSDALIARKVLQTISFAKSVFPFDVTWEASDGTTLKLDDVPMVEEMLQRSVLTDDTGARRREFGYHLRLFGQTKNGVGELTAIFHVQDMSNPQTESVTIDFSRLAIDFEDVKFLAKLSGDLIDLWDPTALDLIDFDWSYEMLDGDILEVPSGHAAYVKGLTQPEVELLQPLASQVGNLWLYPWRIGGGQLSADSAASFKSFCEVLRNAKKREVLQRLKRNRH